MRHFLRRTIVLVVMATIIATSINLAVYYRSRGERVRQLELERKHLEEVINRLTGKQRSADLVVDGQVVNGQGQVLRTTLLWQEYMDGPDDTRVALPIRRIVIPGDTPYIEGYVLKFQDTYVEDGDILRGKSLAFFHRVFSNSLAPDSGTSLLDAQGVPPCLESKSGHPNTFTLKLWQHIHLLMRHKNAAVKLGLEVVQKQAVARPVKPGQLYVIYLQNDGGLEFTQQMGEPSVINQLLKEADQYNSKTAAKPRQ